MTCDALNISQKKKNRKENKWAIENEREREQGSVKALIRKSREE